jgi:hypothetical protein
MRHRSLKFYATYPFGRLDQQQDGWQGFHQGVGDREQDTNVNPPFAVSAG